MEIWTKSKDDLAQLAVRKLAHEAYPHWVAQHRDQECPQRIEELATTNSDDARDPWGRAYNCSARRTCPRARATSRSCRSVEMARKGRQTTSGAGHM